MATSRDNLFEKLSGAAWDTGVTFNRTNPVPIDKFSVFQTLAEASAYALTSVIAYPGQNVAVVSADVTEMYYINTDGSLVKVGTCSSVDNLAEALKDLSTVTLPLSVQTLEQNLTTTVELCATAETGFAKTYVVMQGGQKVGASINIPKDKVIDNAYLVQVSAEVMEEPISAYNVIYYDDDYHTTYVTSADASLSGAFWSINNAWHGYGGGNGPYIRLSIENDPVPVYIAAPKLVDTYVGANTETISVEVGGGTDTTHYISATVNEKSIGEKHLTTSLSNAIKDAMHFRGVGAFDSTLSNNATWAQTSAILSSIPWYVDNVAIAGDLVIKTDTESEFVFTTTGVWKEFGSGSKIADIELSVNNLCVAVDTVDQKFTSICVDLSTAISNEIADRKANDILSIEINGQSFDIASNKASIQISCINCGGAE